MNSRLRMMADARSLFWPWCIVGGTGILSLFSFLRLPGGLDLEVVAGFGFAIGMPLLATLSFGNEFQFGTLSSLLSQPVERSRIWREKTAVIVVVVLSAAIAYGFGADRMGWDKRSITVAALWLMVTVGSSAYWTLLAKSTIGGAVFNGVQSMALVLAFVPLLNRLNAEPRLLSVIAAFAMVYTSVMFYLGRRRLLRFQAGGTGSGSNMLARDWVVTPKFLQRMLRCTASGAVLNLVRKELHLLWPLAPLTLIAFGMLIAITPMRFIADWNWIVTAGISVTFMHGALAAILAGALSLGEERTLGLHAWNMTQPISVRFQWAIKLAMAVLASAACSLAVVLMAKLLIGPDFLRQFPGIFNGGRIRLVVMMFPLLAFIAFWCATAVKGTVRAAFWCLPAAIGVLAAYGFGMSIGMSNGAVEIVRRLTQAVHPFPFSSRFEALSTQLMWWPWNTVIPALWVTVWLLPIAAIQSYRLFRSEIHEDIRPLIRQVLTVAAVAFLCGLLQIVPAAVDRTMQFNTVRALMEISRGVSAMRLAPATVGDGGYTVSLETISNTAPLSDGSRSWLSTDTVVIRPKSGVAKANGFDPLREARYFITAQLHGGWKCAFADNLGEVGRSGVGAMGIPHDVGYRFVCTSKQGSLGWLAATP